MKRLAVLVASIAGFTMVHTAMAGGAPRVSIEFVEFFPSPNLQSGASFEVVFKLKNTGDAPINPYAEVTISGKVYEKKYALSDVDYSDPMSYTGGKNTAHVPREVAVLTIVDKKYNVYNFWPGDITGRQRVYIGVLPKGTFTLRLSVDTFSRVNNTNISSDVFEMELFVK